VASVVEHAAWQQCPTPWMSHTPEKHKSLAPHGAPSARLFPVLVPVVVPLLVEPAVVVPVDVEPVVPLVPLVDAPLPVDELALLAVVLAPDPVVVFVPVLPPHAAAKR
jgi:hypothetical protein